MLVTLAKVPWKLKEMVRSALGTEIAVSLPLNNKTAFVLTVTVTPLTSIFIELLRLMGTAKSDDRKAIIRESLVNLENPMDRKLSPNKRNGSAAIMASRFNNIFETEKVSDSVLSCRFDRKFVC